MTPLQHLPVRLSPLTNARFAALIAFVVAALAAGGVIAWLESRQIDIDRAQVAEQVGDMVHEVEGHVERVLSATYALAALVRQGQGSIRDFEAVATALLPYYPGADSLQLAPGGVLTWVVPLAGNEGAIGHDLLADRQRTKEAFLARDTGKLTLAGPFNLVQGGLGAVGRLPVYLDGADGKPRFWGFTSVLIRFPQVLEKTQLADLVRRGIDYELWRIHPDTGQRQVIAASSTAALAQPVVRQLNMPNGSWAISATPRVGWANPGRLTIKLAIGLLFSLMAARLARQMAELREHRSGLQRLVEQRTAELETRQDELNRAQAVAHTGSWVYDAQSDTLSASAEARRIFGIGQEQALDRHLFAELVPEPERAALLAAWRAALDGADFDIEQRVVVDGDTRWVRLQAELVFGGVPRVLRHAVGSVQDITQQRRSQDQLLRLSAAVEQSPTSIIITDTRGTIEYVNPQFERASGYSAAEVIGQNPRLLNSGTRAGEDFADLWTTISSGRIWRGEFENVHKDGSHYVELASISPIQTASGAISGYVAVKEDITQRRHDEARMREAMVVFNASSQGIVITDLQGVITSVNPACCAITGYAADEMIGQRPSMFRSGRHDAAFYQAMWSTLASTGQWEGEVWNRRKDGQTYVQWITISAVRDERDRLIKYVSHSSDITHRKQREEIIWRQANFDELTGLANRHLLHDRLQRTLASARRNSSRAGLIFIDLDGFKWINDTLGHDVGDQLLVEVATRLQSVMREQDTVARMGGDEFTLVVGDLADGNDLRQVGEKVLRVLGAPFTLAGSTHHVSGSLGLTVYPDDGQDVQTLFRNADIAMYEAKQLGKNRCEFYAQHMRERARLRVELESELRAALEQAQFELHYQPIVDTRSGAMSGAEALLRWRHPERGLVYPGDFIAVAEETGLIVPIGEWVLREAARQIQVWQQQGRRALRVAVNVSGVQYREAGLPELLQRICSQFDLDRSQLMLEITESVLMQGGAMTEARIHEIRAGGLSYALDDFGTGYSSLSYLKRFPVDVVKIDRSFVHDCTRADSDGRLVEAIIQMAHSLDLKVTAEGVETEAQVDFLRHRGCDFLQGYIISKPLPAAEFERLFERDVLLAAASNLQPTGAKNG